MKKKIYICDCCEKEIKPFNFSKRHSGIIREIALNDREGTICNKKKAHFCLDCWELIKRGGKWDD